MPTSNSPFWYGQIVDDLVWKDNEDPTKWQNPVNIPGWQKRYKVRIFSEHPKSKEELSDDSLPLLDVVYPVTGGSGHGASFQSSNLRKGSYVIGIYVEDHQPVILGTYGNSDQTPLLFANPPEGYIPFSGLYNEKVPWYSIPGDGSYGQGSIYGSPNESTGFLGTNWESVSDINVKNRIHKESPLKSSHKCAQGTGQIGAMQLAIIDLITDIEDMKKRTTSWYQGVQDWAENDIKKRIEKAAKDIAKALKDIIEDVRQKVIDTTNDITKALQSLVPANERQKSQRAVETSLDLINCLFDKVVNALISMVVDMLLSIVDRFINAPLCAVEKLGHTLIGNVFGYIMGSVNKIMAPLESIFGASGLISNLQGSVLGFLGDILSFLSCQNDSECPEVTKWSMGGGNGTRSENFSSDIQSVLDQAAGIADKVAELADPDAFSFDLDFSEAVSDSMDQCNVGPLLCGPPTVEFFGGGGGSGAKGNAIVSATGEILGIDMISFGSGYTKAPIAKIVDGCGRGQGAVLLPIMGSNQTGGTLNQSPISINKDPDEDDNPSVIFQGGTKDIIEIDKFSRVTAKSTIQAKWKLIGPSEDAGNIGISTGARKVCLEVIGEGSAEIRIDMKVNDDPNAFGTSFTDAFIKGTNIDFNFGDGQKNDFDTHVFSEGCYDFIITGLVRDILLDSDKKIRLRDTDNEDPNTTFTISQIIQNDFEKVVNEPETEVITIPLTIIDNLTPFVPTTIVEDYDYPRTDEGNINANPCASIKNISLIASYELYENYQRITNSPPDFYPKTNGEWAYHNYGAAAKLWSGENDFVESVVALEGGSGFGLKVRVRLEAVLNVGGTKPGNTRYKIISIRNHGVGYKVGDVLKFPNIKGRPTANMGGVFKITELTSLRSVNGEDSVVTESVEILEGGGLKTFSLYSNYNIVEPTAYYKRNLGEPSYHVWGGKAQAWGDLSDTVVLDVKPIGGSGKDMVLSMRFSAYPTINNEPKNTTYSILEITNPGTGYKPGDRLSVPDQIFSTTAGFELSESAVFSGNIKKLSEMGQIIQVDTVTDSLYEDRIVEQEIIPIDPATTINNNNTTGGNDNTDDDGILPGGGSDVVCPPNLLIDALADTCGKEIKNEDLIGVIQVIVVQPGVGYTNFPDGSLGGSGRKWANPEDTVIQRIDGRWDPPYPPNVALPADLTLCDKIYTPGNPPPTGGGDPPPGDPPPPPDGPGDPPPTDDPPPPGDPGDPGDPIDPGDPFDPGDPDDPFDPGDPPPDDPLIGIPPPPPPPPDFPPSDDEDIGDIPDYPTIGEFTYNVVLYLCDVYIENGGVNYSKLDSIDIVPDRGARAEPIISDMGVLMGVNIIDGGEGFVERPTLTINTTTGYNAVLIPVLCVDRIGDSDETVAPKDVIPVLDCVGKPLEGISTIRPELPGIPAITELPSTDSVDQVVRRPDVPVNEVIDCVGKPPLEEGR
nr:T4-like baseplate hub and tail lysozyme [uncultured Mediterranean phage uvMED]